MSEDEFALKQVCPSKVGEIFYDGRIANFQTSVIVEEFWKSANFWRSHEKISVVHFFDSRCIITVTM